MNHTRNSCCYVDRARKNIFGTSIAKFTKISLFVWKKYIGPLWIWGLTTGLTMSRKNKINLYSLMIFDNRRGFLAFLLQLYQAILQKPHEPLNKTSTHKSTQRKLGASLHQLQLTILADLDTRDNIHEHTLSSTRCTCSLMCPCGGFVLSFVFASSLL